MEDKRSENTWDERDESMEDKMGILLFEKNYIPPLPNPYLFYPDNEEEELRQCENDPTNILILNQKTDENNFGEVRIDFFQYLHDFYGKGKKLFLPCSPQKFLEFLELCIDYTKSIQGKISLIHTEITVFLVIDAQEICLNHENKAFFQKLLDQTFRIDFVGGIGDTARMVVEFTKSYDEPQLIDIEILQNLINEMKRKKNL